MKRGIQFEVPNEWGSHLGEALKPFNISNFDWYNGGEEAYRLTEGVMEPLFHGEMYGMKGEDLSKILQSTFSYIIFADFKAYPQGESTKDVLTYEEFLNSQCQLIVLVVDSSYVAVYCKDTEMLNLIYQNAVEKRYEKVKYITNENDTRTKLSAW